jgi:hypothetical protein
MNIILDKKNEKHRLLNARQKKGLIFLTHGFSDIYYSYRFCRTVGVATAAGGGKSRSPRERHQSVFLIYRSEKLSPEGDDTKKISSLWFSV